MDLHEVLLLVVGGLAAGVVNTLAGGGSLITVPLLVLAGAPGNVANGSNRIGILASNLSAIAAFRRLGVSGVSQAVRVLVPVAIGSLIGALAISRLADETFERVFGVIMIPFLLLSVRPPKAEAVGEQSWSGIFTMLVFLGVGLYGGAFQAGIGILLTVALARSGMDLVVANSVKVVVILMVTVFALPVFLLSGRVDWGPALVLAAGFAVGGAFGAQITVTGGARLIRRVMILAVLALSGRLLGLY
ncbi:MAG: sulfite exporter TauE/SafE family protein [Actinomycetota bacterium]|nr:sulfite exporter TauE/SafE family protein [Actinomycetota bacterium]